MAYSQEQWAKAKFLFELGGSLRDVEKETGISNGAISKKATKEQWQKEAGKQSLKSEIMGIDKEKEALDKKKEALIPRIAKLSGFEITLLDDIVNNQDGLKSYVLSTATLALIRNNQLLTKGTKTVMLKEGQYSSEGQRIGEEYTPYEVPLDSKDIKECSEGIHKAGQSLGVIEQFAPKNDINLTNAQQNNTEHKRVTIARRSDRT